MNDYKTCSKCKQTLSKEFFCKNKSQKDGLSAWCRLCQKRSVKKWRENNPEKSKAASKNWRARNPIRNKEILAESRRKRKEQIKEYNRLYIVNNREKVNKLQSENVKRNPEKARERNAKRRARKKECKTYFISKKDMAKLYAKTCFVCGAKEKIQLDHVIPIAKKGDHSIGNLMPLCQSCNYSKNDLLFMEWKIKKLKTNDWPL